jgi:hypothetical protein
MYYVHVGDGKTFNFSASKYGVKSTNTNPSSRRKGNIKLNDKEWSARVWTGLKGLRNWISGGLLLTKYRNNRLHEGQRIFHIYSTGNFSR